MVGVVGKNNSQGVGIVAGGTKNFNGQGRGVLNCFFLSFSNHENYSIKNFCVYSKSKIKTKVTSKQNLEHFKMINRRLLIHKFCDNSKIQKCCCHPPGQFLLERLCFRLHQEPTIFLLSTCIFRFY